jgi:hypothetical protein
MADVFRSRAVAATAHGARYMTQLAKHWAHKYETEFDKERASIVIPTLGLCLMAATPDALEIMLEAADAPLLERFQGVFERHLARFSFREPDLVLPWEPLS